MKSESTKSKKITQNKKKKKQQQTINIQQKLYHNIILVKYFILI
jgi:hypothetical protein